MNKKLLISLAPLLAIAAFALVPAAQALVPHYYKNNVKLNAGERVQTIGWGVLALASTTTPGKFIECHIAAAGYVEDPAPQATTPGAGATEAFTPYKCISALTCPPAAPFASAAPEESSGPIAGEVASLPWPSTLTREVVGAFENFRPETTGVDVLIGCHVGSEYGPFAGGAKEVILVVRPYYINGACTALNPPFVEFGPGSGELEQEGSGGTIKAKIEGELKILGFETQECISVAFP
jgi:hypothetical protein